MKECLVSIYNNFQIVKTFNMKLNFYLKEKIFLREIKDITYSFKYSKTKFKRLLFQLKI